MTITTVGYAENPKASIQIYQYQGLYKSEMNFQSVLGKFVGGFCALVGVFTITLPIPIVVNSFAGFYKNTLMRNEVNSKKRERLMSERHKWRKELQELVTRGEITQQEVKLSSSLGFNS